MKLYLFNPESGVYAGETFDERGIMNRDEGVTAIAPPEFARGQVPVFDRVTGGWSIFPIATVRQVMTRGLRATEIQP
jgi:hypothetical protein